MERLTSNRRPKTGDKMECLPAGDGLPIWTTTPLDAKLPMMQNPKGSVILYTTKLCEPKHRCKQQYDFDLRDPNGRYICNEYQPLHDPHLRSHFNTHAMRRHLIRKGFISENGKVLCSLKEFNQYRQYLRHIFFLGIARERKQQLEKKPQEQRMSTDLHRAMSRGAVVRRRLQQQREYEMNRLKKDIASKTERLENRLQEIRDEMTRREQKQREEAERRHLTVYRYQQEAEQRSTLLLKKWRHRERARNRLMEDRESQRILRAEIQCMTKWNSRKLAQKQMMERDEGIIKQEDEYRVKSILKRDKIVSRQRERLDRKIEKLKTQSREDKQKREEQYAKRFEEKLLSGDYRTWRRRRDKRHPHEKTFYSTWKLEDVLNTFDIGDVPKRPGNVAADKAVHTQDELEDAEIKARARAIVQNVLSKVENDLWPAYLKALEDEECDAIKSRSVRFSTEDEIVTDGPQISSASSSDQCYKDAGHYKPVSEHVLTPCTSQLEIQKMEAEALLGSPEMADKTNSLSFVETLLLRLLEDLNSGRLSKEDIMKLASYSMGMIQSTESKDTAIVEAPEESDDEDPYLVSSSTSVIAKKMVDFTLNKILNDLRSGTVHFDDITSLTVSLLDYTENGESNANLPVSDADLDSFITDTLQEARSSALNPREDSPVCDALLDDFMVRTLKNLIKDLEDESLTKFQISSLAASVKEETRHILHAESDGDIQSAGEIQNVLLDVLRQLQSGEIDLQTLYQIVFAIVFSYNMIKSSSTPCFESRVTDLMRDILFTVEQKADTNAIDNININIIHEANRRLSKTNLDVKQIEQMSASIIGVVTQEEVICKTSTSEIARSIVENALTKAKEELAKETNNYDVIQGFQNVAESLILTIADEDQIETSESPMADIFVEVLEQLRSTAELSGAIENNEIENITSLIDQILTRSISPNELTEMATSVARVLKSPVKSQSSFVASLVVKDVLKRVREDLIRGSFEDQIIRDMIDTVTTSCRSVQSNNCKSPALLHSLASFLKSVLGHVSYKVECGEFDENDIAEMSRALKENIEKKVMDCEVTNTVPKETKPVITKAETIIEHLNILLDELETEELNSIDVQTLGKRLVECGNYLKASISNKSSCLNFTPGSDIIAEDVVEEVIRSLQLEIDSGMLTKDSLKEITKTIISTTSDSDIANDIVEYTIRGIHRDIERGYDPTKISSVPTLDHSPSASTIASNVVIQTIETLTNEIMQSGRHGNMISSIASSVVSIINERKCHMQNLPQEFERVRKTVELIVDCLRQDQINHIDTERIFCVILEHYKSFVLQNETTAHEETDSLADEDVALVDLLITETLKSVKRSVIKGRVNSKTFSIPSMPHSEDTSVMAEEFVDVCLENMKKNILQAENKPYKIDIADFMIEIVSGLQAELSEGTISKLSMAHFYQSISGENKDLNTLEANAASNLSKVVYDIKKYRSSSEYVHRIIELYLISDEASDGLFSDPVKAIESILISVSSEILTKFVKATLQNILIEMREGTGSVAGRSPSVYVLRSASSIVAENVIQEVIDRIKHDMSGSVHRVHGAASKKQIERAASRMFTPVPSERKTTDSTNKPNKIKSDSKQCMSSVLSKEVEDIVLETLHNSVSNLRFETSMQPKKTYQKEDDDLSIISHEIQDFVLQTMQTIVTDLQDKRSLGDLDDVRTESKYGGSSIELVSGESREAAAYVNEVLQNVLADMKVEMKVKEATAQTETQSKRSDVSSIESVNLETMIVDCLKNAVSDRTIPTRKHTLDPNQENDVRKILTESIKGTIINIRENEITESDLQIINASLVKFLSESDSDFLKTESQNDITTTGVIHLLELVLNKVDVLGLDENTLNRISTQLATLGMDSVTGANIKKTPQNILSDSSVASSDISELIKDVITKISEQMFEDGKPHVESDSNQNILKNKTIQLTSENKESHQKNDVNYNRRVSASSHGTDSTFVTGISDTADKEILCGNQKLELYDFDIPDMKKVNKVDKTRRNADIKMTKNAASNKKLTRRSSEPKPMITKQPTPSKLLNIADKKVKTSPNKTSKNESTSEEKNNKHSPIIRSYIDAKFSQNNKKCTGMPKRNHPTVKPSRSEKKTLSVLACDFNKSISSSISSSMPIRKTGTDGKKASKNRLKTSAKSQRSERSHDLAKYSPKKPPPLEPKERPIELKSLCGVHKTKIRLRDCSTPQSASSGHSPAQDCIEIPREN